ncbi:MAG TPA: ATP-binding protein [Nitrospirae bacterium]|nr:archaeal ATPase [bacterium BMS3Abin09]GBE41737.1 archaeal ATPase [bacterium BMS3Bbin09]HDZ84615.1 ATP-binding protein [Nitrospirota bacterium]
MYNNFMYYARSVTDNALRLFKQYPIVTITGPRQSGKTTLCKRIFNKLDYVSLEDITNRAFAENDPLQFLNKYAKGAVIDEVQRVPSLISYLQTFVDNKGRNSLFVLTGSRQFELMDSINQSLAGRTALIRLLPFSYDEIYTGKKPLLEEVLYRGFYPRIFAEKLDPTEMYSFYTNTYLERDVRQIINVQDIRTFEVFLKLCAGRNAQVLNYSAIGNDCGVDNKTVKKWLSILEASYIIKPVSPYYKNLNKRLVKSPKLYFYDTGLVCYLLGIHNPRQLENHPLAGAIFESFVFSELWKSYYNNIRSDNLFYFRDTRGREVDGILDKVVSISQFEIKKSSTISSSFFKTLEYLKTLTLPVDKSFLIYGGDDTFLREGTWIISWRDISRVLELEELPSE